MDITDQCIGCEINQTNLTDVTSATDIANIVNDNPNNANDYCECETGTSDVYHDIILEQTLQTRIKPRKTVIVIPIGRIKSGLYEKLI